MNQEPKGEQATSVADYRKNLGKISNCTLPSGAVFKLRRLTPMDFIREGLADIPNDFLKFVSELGTKVTAGSTPEEEKANYDLFQKFLEIVVEKGIISPPTILMYKEEKADTHLLFGELSNTDQIFVANYILGVASDG